MQLFAKIAFHILPQNNYIMKFKKLIFIYKNENKFYARMFLP